MGNAAEPILSDGRGNGMRIEIDDPILGPALLGLAAYGAYKLFKRLSKRPKKKRDARYLEEG